ncbi:haloacid dehalogenase-like hydrolase [Nannocystis pusilla]|uniref:HAD family hydrolase n=1 Tax=Nannocystis pusilla TaxID=889268 RepID=UPI003DA50DAC
MPDSAEDNAARVAAVVEPLARASVGRVVFLVDGDRTLSPDDTSRTFLALAGLDPLVIKRRFQREGYVFSAFRFHAEMHVQLGEAAFAELAPRVAAAAPLYPGVPDFLAAAAEVGQVFVVSAGIPRIWRSLLDRLGRPDVGVIGGIDPADPFVFGRAEKGTLATLFRQHASRLVAVGDSDVDTEMLRLADHAVVVVDHRRNVDLLPGLVGHRSLWQIAPTGEPHPSIPELSFSTLATLARPSAPAAAVPDPIVHAADASY